MFYDKFSLCFNFSCYYQWHMTVKREQNKSWGKLKYGENYVRNKKTISHNSQIQTDEITTCRSSRKKKLQQKDKDEINSDSMRFEMFIYMTMEKKMNKWNYFTWSKLANKMTKTSQLEAPNNSYVLQRKKSQTLINFVLRLQKVID